MADIFNGLFNGIDLRSIILFMEGNVKEIRLNPEKVLAVKDYLRVNACGLNTRKTREEICSACGIEDVERELYPEGQLDLFDADVKLVDFPGEESIS